MRRVALLCALLPLAAPGRADDKLSVGSRAPALAVAKWVKGSPVKSFETGRAYVVEFWATWCGPCLESIPHLTALAKQFRGEVTFVGVAVWDREPGANGQSYVDRVSSWVQEKGREMDYTVAIDDEKDSVSNAWMKAAGQNGIPTAFVIDQGGRVAWIGHPMAGLDKVVALVAKGEFTVEAAQKLKEEEAARSKAVRDCTLAARSLVQAGKTEEGFAELDRLVQLDPTMAKYLPVMKWEMLTEADEVKGMELARNYLATTYRDDAEMNETIGTYIAMGYVQLKNPDYELAVQALDRAVTLKGGKVVAQTLMALAEAYAKKGDKTHAVSTIKKAIVVANVRGRDSQKLKEALEKKLESYEKG